MYITIASGLRFDSLLYITHNVISRKNDLHKTTCGKIIIDSGYTGTTREMHMKLSRHETD